MMVGTFGSGAIAGCGVGLLIDEPVICGIFGGILAVAVVYLLALFLANAP
jgi:hypothetical protein